MLDTCMAVVAGMMRLGICLPGPHVVMARHRLSNRISLRLPGHAPKWQDGQGDRDQN
jgi:hypothetical protein